MLVKCCRRRQCVGAIVVLIMVARRKSKEQHEREKRNPRGTVGNCQSTYANEEELESIEIEQMKKRPRMTVVAPVEST